MSGNGHRTTELEARYLAAIATDDYTDGDPTAWVWSWSPAQGFGKQAGGIAASLCKKGLAEVDGLDGDEACIRLTEEGLKVVVRRWMSAHAEDYRDGATGELNPTGLAEGAAAELCLNDEGGPLDDPDHWIWELALEPKEDR